MLVLRTMEQVEQAAQRMTRHGDEAVSGLTLAQQSEWATVKAQYVEALYQSVQTIMRAKAAYDMAVLEEQNKQPAAREELRGWLVAHGVDLEQVSIMRPGLNITSSLTSIPAQLDKSDVEPFADQLLAGC